MRLFRSLLFVSVVMLTLVPTPVTAQHAGAQVPGPAPTVVGIPSSATLEPSGEVIFSDPSQSLTVEFRPSGLADDASSARLSYDGQSLTIAAPAPYFNVSVLPPDAGACVAVNGLESVTRCSIASGQLSFEAPSVPCRGGLFCPVPVDYPAGWNLIAATSGPGRAHTVINSNVGPFYTLQAGDSGYEAVGDSSTLQPGQAYWAYFAEPTSASLASTYEACACPPLFVTQPPPLLIDLPPGQFVMIGNPFSVPAAVSGADAVYAHDPAAGYQLTAQLQPGQGAFVYSLAGGAMTLSPANP